MKKGLLITLIVIAFLLSNALAVVVTWLVLRPTATTEPVPTVNEVQIPPSNTVDNNTPSDDLSFSEPELEVPDDWEDFASVEYETVFQYPPEWGSPDAQLITGVNDSLYDFPELAITFGDGVPIGRYVRIAELNNLGSLQGGDAEVALKDVYESRGVDSLSGASYLAVLPLNAGLLAYTDPIYIQNPSGSFRGFYAYTVHAQNDPGFSGSAELTELLMVLTNGDVVVQVTVSVAYDAEVNYTAASSCNVAAGLSGVYVPDTCAIPRELEIDRQNLLLFATSLSELKSL